LSEQHASEVASADRFEFGANWTRFLATLDDDSVERATRSLADMLETDDLHGVRFLDVGSGSGLFSLAARRLGAQVRSFDYDPRSVACTRELRARFFPDDRDWQVDEASVLDKDFVESLGRFDVVYAWGVLHHTGAMWQALDNVAGLVASGGRLFVALYNDQGRISRQWRATKRAYNALPRPLRFLVLAPSLAALWWRPVLKDLVTLHPGRSFGGSRDRGMRLWRDAIDWVGGYPFEVSSPGDVFDFYRKRGFSLARLKTVGGGHGCNEFVFERDSSP
jgi:SAM-dependent methyltransferase